MKGFNSNTRFLLAILFVCSLFGCATSEVKQALPDQSSDALLPPSVGFDYEIPKKDLRIETAEELEEAISAWIPDKDELEPTLQKLGVSYDEFGENTVVNILLNHTTDMEFVGLFVEIRSAVFDADEFKPAYDEFVSDLRSHIVRFSVSFRPFKGRITNIENLSSGVAILTMEGQKLGTNLTTCVDSTQHYKWAIDPNESDASGIVDPVRKFQLLMLQSAFQNNDEIVIVGTEQCNIHEGAEDIYVFVGRKHQLSYKQTIEWFSEETYIGEGNRARYWVYDGPQNKATIVFQLEGDPGDKQFYQTSAFSLLDPKIDTVTAKKINIIQPSEDNLGLRRLIKHKEFLKNLDVSFPDGITMVMTSFREFAPKIPLYEYYPAEDKFVNLRDGSTLTANKGIGFFVDDDNKPIAPGFYLIPKSFTNY